MTTRIYSADSHITEHPDTYRKYIEPKFRERAPYLLHGDESDVYVIPEMPNAVLPMGLIAAAGQRSEEIKLTGRFADWHRGGWDPEARLADQDRDGVAGEILYPTVGMVLCGHQDFDLKQACSGVRKLGPHILPATSSRSWASANRVELALTA